MGKGGCVDKGSEAKTPAMVLQLPSDVCRGWLAHGGTHAIAAILRFPTS